MFGCIVAGRLVQAEPIQVDPMRFVFEIPDANNINHIVVFLTGTVAFPPGLGASVYFGWPKPETVWQYLGFLSNDKPSAVFKLAKTRPKASSEGNPFGADVEMMGTMGEERIVAQIGISIEPLEQIQQQTPAADPATQVTPNTVVTAVQKMLQHFFNYAESFAVPPNQLRLGETYVPSSTVMAWYNNFERRIQGDPNFWKE